VSYPLVLAPGQRVGPYAVAAALRSGGMASLYLAHRTGPQGFARPVALKVIHPHLSQDAQFVRMFVDEALLCARIRHPNVVHVEELGQHGGAYYLAMEYVDGCSLAELLDGLNVQGELMEPRIAVSIACAVLEGLHATHTVRGDQNEALDVVHRDVSPSNVLIDRTGHVKLIDFGIAKARGRAVETSAGTLKGKYAYMSPEQAFGRAIDARTDIYAAGVVLWEMLATRPMFSGDSDLAVLEMARASNIPRLTMLVPSVPESLADVVAWALESKAEQRPSSARELRKALLDAFPEAREVDASEIAQLLARTSILPSRPPLAQTPSDVLGPTHAATPIPDVAASGVSKDSFEGRVSQAARTNVTQRTWRSLWIAAAMLLLLGVSWVAFSLNEPGKTTRSPAALPAVPVPSPTAKATSPGPSLAEPPHVAVPPAEAKQPLAEPADPAPAKRTPGTRTKKPNTKSRDFDGVPIVDQPGF